MHGLDGVLISPEDPSLNHRPRLRIVALLTQTGRNNHDRRTIQTRRASVHDRPRSTLERCSIHGSSPFVDLDEREPTARNYGCQVRVRIHSPMAPGPNPVDLDNPRQRARATSRSSPA
jgi:hypothetical protein